LPERFEYQVLPVSPADTGLADTLTEWGASGWRVVGSLISTEANLISFVNTSSLIMERRVE
jgi:hypothetical protein